MKKFAVLATLSVLLILSCGVAAAQPEKAPAGPVAMTVVVAGDCDRGEESIEVERSRVFKVTLYAAGGTGYAWMLDGNDFSLVEVAGDSSEPVDPKSNLAGGRVKWSFTIKVKDEATGQETLRFVLRRVWEKNVQPARSFDLTVVAK